MYKWFMYLSLIVVALSGVLAFVEVLHWFIALALGLVCLLSAFIFFMLQKRSDKRRLDQQVDDYIRSLFVDKKILQLNQEIALVCQGEYTHHSNLEVYYKNECICTLEEFKKMQLPTYETILRQLKDIPLPQQEKKEEIIQDAFYFIKIIDDYNIDIEDEEISQGLYETTALLRHVHLIEKKYPESYKKLNKLYQYYLPIMLTILKTFVEIDEHTRSEDRKNIKERLLKTILLVNEAIKALTDSLIQEKKMDLASDMSTLEAVLKKDGLLEDDFVKNLREKEMVYSGSKK